MSGRPADRAGRRQLLDGAQAGARGAGVGGHLGVRRRPRARLEEADGGVHAARAGAGGRGPSSRRWRRGGSGPSRCGPRRSGRRAPRTARRAAGRRGRRRWRAPARRAPRSRRCGSPGRSAWPGGRRCGGPARGWRRGRSRPARWWWRRDGRRRSPWRCGGRSARRRRRGADPASSCSSVSFTMSAAVRDLALVHAHVERRVVPVAEAARGAVELGAADPQVEEHAAHRCRVRAAARSRPRRRTGCGGGAPGPRRARAARRPRRGRRRPGRARAPEGARGLPAAPRRAPRHRRWRRPPSRVAPGRTARRSAPPSPARAGTRRGRLVAGVAHLQPPGELVPAGMSPRNGLDGKRAERGPSIALPGGLQGSDAAPRISVVVLLLSSCGGWVGAVTVGAVRARTAARRRCRRRRRRPRGPAVLGADERLPALLGPDLGPVAARRSRRPRSPSPA